MSSHFGTGDRARVVFDGRYDLSPGLVRAQASGYPLLLGQFKVFLLLIILQVVRITTSKGSFDNQTLKIRTA